MTMTDKAAEVAADAYALTGKLPRQVSPDLLTALRHAAAHFRSQAQAYRSQHHPNKQRLHKSVRRALAASNDDWARAIETHIAHLAASGGGDA